MGCCPKTTENMEKNEKNNNKLNKKNTNNNYFNKYEIKKNEKNINNNNDEIINKVPCLILKENEIEKAKVPKLNLLDYDNISDVEEREKSSFNISKYLETPVEVINQNKIKIFPEDKKPPHLSKMIKYKKNESHSTN